MFLLEEATDPQVVVFCRPIRENNSEENLNKNYARAPVPQPEMYIPLW